MIPISESQMVEYRATAAKRKRWEAERLAQRHQFAWEIAQRAATILKAEFVVRNVYTFHLRQSRLEELAGEVRACYEKTSQDILAFRDFLNRFEV